MLSGLRQTFRRVVPFFGAAPAPMPAAQDNAQLAPPPPQARRARRAAPVVVPAHERPAAEPQAFNRFNPLGHVAHGIEEGINRGIQKAVPIVQQQVQHIEQRANQLVARTERTFEQAGNRLVRTAEQKATRLIANAEQALARSSAAIIGNAQAQANQLLAQAEERGKRIITEATTQARQELNHTIASEEFQKTVSVAAQKIIQDIQKSPTGKHGESAFNRYFNTAIYTLCGLGGASASLIIQSLENRNYTSIPEIKPSKKHFATKVLRCAFAGVAMQTMGYSFLNKQSLSLWMYLGFAATLGMLKASELYINHQIVHENTLSVLKSWPDIKPRLTTKGNISLLEELHLKIKNNEKITPTMLTQATSLLQRLGFNRDISGLRISR